MSNGAPTGIPGMDSMDLGPERQRILQRRRVWANRVIFIGKCIILILVIFLAYLLWTVRAGYNTSPEKKYLIGQSILPFQLPEGYQVSFASNGIFSKIVVIDNPKSNQRIVLNRVYFRKDRKPEGFHRKFNHPGERIKLRKSTFTGLENPKIMEYKFYNQWYHECPYTIVESYVNNGVRKGMIFCLYCPITGKSYFVESAASFSTFSEKEVFEFIDHLGSCHKTD